MSRETIHTAYDPAYQWLSGEGWTAVFDSYCGAPDSDSLMGYGATEDEATQDLMDRAAEVES